MPEQATTEVHVTQNSREANSDFLSPDTNMLILTWITFFLLLAVLYKFAWRPILSALDKREEAIRRSVEEAERIKAELAKMDQTRQKMLVEIEAKSKAILDQSRKGAVEVAKIIQEKAKEEARILVENALREVKEETEKAQANLREESANIAIRLASKLIEKNLDDERNKKLIDEFIREI